MSYAFLKRRVPMALATLALAGLSAVAFADAPAIIIANPTGIDGFGSGFVLNNNGAAPPSIAGNTLQITVDGVNYTANSAFYSTPQPIDAFTADFIYQAQYDPSLNPNGLEVEADGATFVMQNDPNGDNALGYWGSDLGYSNEQDSSASDITNSVALAFNIYSGHTVGTNLLENGQNPNFKYNATGNVNLQSNDPIGVSLNYDGGTLSEDLTDESTGASFHTSYPVNIASVVGGAAAYVGFTGGTGGGFSSQYFSNFTFTPNSDMIVTPGTVIGGGSAKGMIKLASPVAANTVFTLTNPDPTDVTMPAQVTVAKGHSSASFNITTQPVSTPGVIEVAAQSSSQSLAAGFNLKPANLATGSIQLSADPVVGGTWLGATVTLSGPAPAGGAVVNLDISPNPFGAVQSFLSAPPGTAGSTTILSVNIPAGQTSATFYIQTTQVPNDVTVRIQGKYNGVTSGAPLTVDSPQG